MSQGGIFSHVCLHPIWYEQAFKRCQIGMSQCHYMFAYTLFGMSKRLNVHAC